mmetsp:Transcript_52812/g.115199  ORF Transcript_52812/g.115199 Transcript_52812/m.115199 type:complete len:469 (-) Transcript_52812:609-2015(-)
MSTPCASRRRGRRRGGRWGRRPHRHAPRVEAGWAREAHGVVERGGEGRRDGLARGEREWRRGARLAHVADDGAFPAVHRRRLEHSRVGRLHDGRRLDGCRLRRRRLRRRRTRHGHLRRRLLRRLVGRHLRRLVRAVRLRVGHRLRVAHRRRHLGRHGLHRARVTALGSGGLLPVELVDGHARDGNRHHRGALRHGRLHGLLHRRVHRRVHLHVHLVSRVGRAGEALRLHVHVQRVLLLLLLLHRPLVRRALQEAPARHLLVTRTRVGHLTRLLGVVHGIAAIWPVAALASNAEHRGSHLHDVLGASRGVSMSRGRGVGAEHLAVVVAVALLRSFHGRRRGQIRVPLPLKRRRYVLVVHVEARPLLGDDLVGDGEGARGRTARAGGRGRRVARVRLGFGDGGHRVGCRRGLGGALAEGARAHREQQHRGVVVRVGLGVVVGLVKLLVRLGDAPLVFVAAALLAAAAHRQ